MHTIPNDTPSEPDTTKPYTDMPFFTIIIPVYNRPDEIEELLESLTAQTYKEFDIVLVEDGSTIPCDKVAARYNDKLEIHYYYKPNEGRSIARNYGMERADGQYFVFFDSDCIIPPTYFATVKKQLDQQYCDCYGGPDAAHDSFSQVQKAINYSMTSFLTTGGIRGGGQKLDKFTPRSFNMGFSREVYEKVGGYKNMTGEDIDLSMRIRKAGFESRLIPDAFVYHKRRVDFRKFWRQVHVFGQARVDLMRIYPEQRKLVYTLPALFVIAVILMLAGMFVTPWTITPLAIYLIAIFAVSWAINKSPIIAALSIVASLIQLIGYGTGFLKSFFTQYILRREFKSRY